MRKSSPNLPDPKDIPEEVVTDDWGIQFVYSGGDTEIRRQLQILARYYLIHTELQSSEGDILGVEYGWQSRHQEGLVRPGRIRIVESDRVQQFISEIQWPTIEDITNRRIIEIAYEYEQKFEQEIYEK